MRSLATLLVFIGSLISTACEDVITVQLDDGETLLVVDAFLNNAHRDQIIRLTQSMPYLAAGEAPKVSGARVSVVDAATGWEYFFREIEPGTYRRAPRRNDGFAEIGKEYELRIRLGQDDYRARSRVNPVPRIDTIVYDYEEKNPFQEAGYQAYFIAFDLEGQTDYYLIRSYRNGLLRSRNIDFQVSVDAAYGEGADGLQFIEPLADFTPGDDPYRVGDSASVELASIDKHTYGFLSQLSDVSSNAGLFATPPANLPTNIESLGPDPALKPAGWFVISAISAAGTRIEAR